ncbi:MAG: ABC transporter permease [Acidobacteria bacterium]|nr:ABC transporter permease [Acidobacteriota bacterium]
MKSLGSIARKFPEAFALALLVIACFAAPLITGPEAPWAGLLVSPTALDLPSALSPPGLQHWMGTDYLGRDLFSRLLHGGRSSLGIATTSAILALLLGAMIGLWAGHEGGWIDLWAGRLIEAADSLPTLMLALVAAASGLGRGAMPIILIVAATRWTDSARVARAEALRWRNSLHRQSAQAAGASAPRLLLRHLLPIALPMLATACAITAAETLVLEASLGLIGFGVEPPCPTWGNLLLDARTTIDVAWWPAIFPGAAMFVAVAGFLAAARQTRPQRLQLRQSGRVGAVPGLR